MRLRWTENRVTLLALGASAAVVGWRVVRQARAMDLRGRVVLVTGSSRGLGLAMAREFARQGAKLVLCARNAEQLEWARRDIEQIGVEVLAVTCDVADRESVNRLITAARERFGRIDVLVNNAGTIIVGPLATQTLVDFEEAMDTMFWGALYTTFAVLPEMRARGNGRIVNITSIGGKVSVPHLLSYAAAKFALVGLSEGMRAELAKDGVTVITVAPGLMRTGSYVNAIVKGRHREEFTWFGLGDNLPGIAMSASRAARQIVAATRRGDSEVVLTWAARLLALSHGIAPGLTADINGIVNRFLPESGGIGEGRALGRDSETPFTRSWIFGLGKRAIEQFHQQPVDAVIETDAASAARARE